MHLGQWDGVTVSCSTVVGGTCGVGVVQRSLSISLPSPHYPRHANNRLAHARAESPRVDRITHDSGAGDG